MTTPITTEIFARDLEDATRLRELLNATDDGSWRAGSAEPWIAEVVAALIVANDVHTAVEIGGFQGYTSLRIARALARLPHDSSLTVCEIDPVRAADVQAKLTPVTTRVRRSVVIADSLAWIPTLRDSSIDFCWLDGNHEHEHVAREIELLFPKLAPGGIICGHDAFGTCNLQQEFRKYGGYALDLARLGPAGGIGLLQRFR
jgi:predicted O-methyltransferase YrrM